MSELNLRTHGLPVCFGECGNTLIDLLIETEFSKDVWTMVCRSTHRYLRLVCEFRRLVNRFVDSFDYLRTSERWESDATLRGGHVPRPTSYSSSSVMSCLKNISMLRTTHIMVQYVNAWEERFTRSTTYLEILSKT